MAPRTPREASPSPPPRGVILEAARGGTLFLDEIGDIPASTQVKLLGALQHGEICALGSTRPRKVDVRIVAATNREPSSFRKDLYYRLEALQIRMPPLRDRREDLPALVAHFCPGLRVEPDALDTLSRHDFPGNVRELENLLKVVRLTGRGALRRCDLPESMLTPGPAAAEAEAPRTSRELGARRKKMTEEMTRQFLRRILENAKGNIAQAARAAGMKRPKLSEMLRRYGIDPGRFRGE